MIGSEPHNPFRQFRAEQLREELWKLYVPFPATLLTPRPLILEGGRGSGKTMFFICNSWRDRLLSLESLEKTIGELLTANESVGIYYRVEPFLKYMTGNGRNDWDHIFSTYLSICIIKELLFLCEELISEGILVHSDMIKPFSVFETLFNDNRNVTNFPQAFEACNYILNEIENIINSPNQGLNIKLTVVGTLVSKFIDQLTFNTVFSNTTFRIYIDEYETLLEYQQRIINTLIKYSNYKVIYNIGMRPRGMKTSLTISDTEIIQQPDDYHLFKPESFFTPEDNEGQKVYLNILYEICKKRIMSLGYNDKLNTDIKFYLGEYDINKEIEDIVLRKSPPPFFKELKKQICFLEPDPNKAETFIQVLAENAHPINARLHLCLLKRTKRYRPDLTELVQQYKGWLSGENNKYREWFTHNKLGLVFLLSNEYPGYKQFYGYEVFAMLSSGVIRYFLELCEQAFDFAFSNGFDWDSIRPLSPQEQTKAARYVSRYKIRNIEKYEPYGRNLRILVQNIGEIFKEYHQNSELTLGEPEPNHFSTDYFKISQETKRVLDSAIMWAVLQERPSNKSKETFLPLDVYDFHLNHIYCPYFGISYRKKHKMEFSPEDLDILCSGNEAFAKDISLNHISKLKKRNEVQQASAEIYMNLFDGDKYD